VVLTASGGIYTNQFQALADNRYPAAGVDDMQPALPGRANRTGYESVTVCFESITCLTNPNNMDVLE
jgi:hypothetical protein